MLPAKPKAIFLWFRYYVYIFQQLSSTLSSSQISKGCKHGANKFTWISSIIIKLKGIHTLIKGGEPINLKLLMYHRHCPIPKTKETIQIY